jgi:hypothetical protein
MSTDLKLSRGWTYGGVTVSDDEIFPSADLDISESRPTLTAEGVDEEVAKTIDVSLLKVLFIKSSQDITIETNDPDAPTDTIELAAGRALLWSDGCGMDCPFSADVTALYCTNAATEAPTLFIGVGYDATPGSTPS